MSTSETTYFRPEISVADFRRRALQYVLEEQERELGQSPDDLARLHHYAKSAFGCAAGLLQYSRMRPEHKPDDSRSVLDLWMCIEHYLQLDELVECLEEFRNHPLEHDWPHETPVTFFGIGDGCALDVAIEFARDVDFRSRCYLPDQVIAETGEESIRLKPAPDPCIIAWYNRLMGDLNGNETLPPKDDWPVYRILEEAGRVCGMLDIEHQKYNEQLAIGLLDKELVQAQKKPGRRRLSASKENRYRELCEGWDKASEAGIAMKQFCLDARCDVRSRLSTSCEGNWRW